jgi:hypothetical protein
MNKKLPLIILIVAVFVLGACSSNQSVSNDRMDDNDSMSTVDPLTDTGPQEDEMKVDDSILEEPLSDDMSDSDISVSDDAMTEMPMPDTPAWFAHEFTDARTGQSFRINDFQGKVVLVETMAMWCSNCFRQQTQVHEFHALLGERDDFISVGLDIDPNENISALIGYVEKNGFDWLYSVPPVEVSREIGNLYGAQFLNPPSTPILIVDRHGVAHPLPFGIKSANDLLGIVEPFLNENL